ncbi:MAG: hypothetical protein QM820_35835 [Minicystis sp.]
MDIVPSICLSSLAGAIFFFTGGRLSARGPQANGGEALEAERAARAAAEQEAARAAEARDQAARARDEAARARDEATRARDEAARAHGEMARALAAEQGRVVAQARTLDNERAARVQEAQQAAAEIARIGDERARLEASATALANEITEMRARIAADSGAAARAQMSAGPAEARAAAAEKRATALAADLEKARGELNQARGELSQALDAKKRLGAEVTDLKARVAQREGAEGTAVREAQATARREAEAAARSREAHLHKEIEQARNERTAALGQLDQARAALAAVEKRAAEADRLRGEIAELRAAKAAEPASQGGAPDLAELQRRGLELTLKARVIEQRTEEMERARVENAELRARVETLNDTAREAEELRRRVAELEAQGFARRLVEPAPPSRPSPEGAGLSTILERELGRLVGREEGCRMAVLADPRGLLIAASEGASYPHEVAAASSLTTFASDRLRELMPLGAPASLEIYDENGLCMRTRWIRFEKEWFLVSTVGVVDPHDVEAADLRSRLGELIGR